MALDLQICKNTIQIGSNIINELYNQSSLLYIVNRNLLDINYIINVTKRKLRGMTFWGKIINLFSFNPRKVIEKEKEKEEEIELQTFPKTDLTNDETCELLIELDKLQILSRNINVMLVNSNKQVDKIEANLISSNVKGINNQINKMIK